MVGTGFLSFLPNVGLPPPPASVGGGLFAPGAWPAGGGVPGQQSGQGSERLGVTGTLPPLQQLAASAAAAVHILKGTPLSIV